jgi:hypothetical protein
MSEAAGPGIDPETACIACGLQSSLETMLICDTCQQGFHLACFGLPSIPEDDEWICQGCEQLGMLSVGQPLVLEMAQLMYTDSQDPHLTQGLFKGYIRALGAIDRAMLPPRREVQVLVEDAPVRGSLVFYSRASFSRLKRVPRESLQLAEQLYQRTTSQLTTVVLCSSRWDMFGLPAAAAGRASEAWASGQDAVQRALQVLQQPPKQLYLHKPPVWRLVPSSRPPATCHRCTMGPSLQPYRRQQLVNEAAGRSSPGPDEYSSDDDWVPETAAGTPFGTGLCRPHTPAQRLPHPAFG